jgi:hypothetical protein
MNKSRLLGASVLLIVAVMATAAASLSWAQATAPPYKAPRTPDGQPNLQGVWQVLNTAAWDIQDHGGRIGVPAGQGVVEGGEIPYQPSALAKKQKNFESRATEDPETKCFAPGVPRLTYMPFPFQIVQTQADVAFFYEYNHFQRFVYTDGSKHPVGIPFWIGDSRGRWEGETLVVDSIDFTDQTWFDRAGNFHSDALHVVERYTRTGLDHIQYEVTIDDPKVFTRSWKMSMPLYRRQEPRVQLLEYACYEDLTLEKFFPGRR